MDNLMVQHIEKSAEVMGGKARIAGHRIRVLDIVVWHEKRGLSPDEILGVYPSITLADVHAALAYYFDHRDEIEGDLVKEAELVAGMKARFPSKLQERLGA
ncbi:MAG: DUF433 domain-containing protein [Planctomycetes bacterium]|nr:DUF433 domain-containing protein [Planctomycetota bacterium]